MARRSTASRPASAQAPVAADASVDQPPAGTEQPAPASPVPAPAPTPRRRNNVAGPTSALTSFLREHGIQSTIGRSGWGSARTPETPSTPPVTGPSSPTAEPPVTPGRAETPAASSSKRKAATGRGKGKGKANDDLDSDDLDEDSSLPFNSKNQNDDIDSDDLDSPALPAPKRAKKAVTTRDSTVDTGDADTVLKPIGEFMVCCNCVKQFTVTAYTRPSPSNNGYLCYDCATSLGIDVFAKPKRKRGAVDAKGKAVKEKRGKVVSYEEIRGPVGLGDLCIKLIGRYIEDVEALGNIGSKSMDKVCRIISKSRRLTAETATLFYSGDRTSLRMYDCTNLVPASYVTLAALCPNLETLSLELCGRLDTDTLIKWGLTLDRLKVLELWGPFNVRKEGWIKFFQTRGQEMEGLLITQSPRFDEECLEAMVEHCPQMRDLRFREFGLLKDSWLPTLSRLQNLESLDLSAPGHTSFTDDPVIEMLSKIGPGLSSLSLEDHIRLTDKTLMEGILKHCPNIRKLDLSNIADYTPPQEDDMYEKTGLTNEGVAEFFKAWKESGHDGLVIAELRQNHELKEEALMALLDHSGATLEKLDIKGWRMTSEESLKAIAKKCPNLRWLNVGWCRMLTDFTMKDILEGCPKIEVIKAWGCNKLTVNVPRKQGCRVTGIEGLTIGS